MVVYGSRIGTDLAVNVDQTYMQNLGTVIELWHLPGFTCCPPVAVQVIQVQNTLKALEILEVFLEMARTRTEYLAKQKQIPEEMRTSLMSIAYAANRMPDIPELASIRKQFEGRFGREAFADIGMEDPASAGVQAKLVKFLTVDPPRPTEKVDIALKIVEQRQLECTEAELNEVCETALSSAVLAHCKVATLPCSTLRDLSCKPGTAITLHNCLVASRH